METEQTIDLETALRYVGEYGQQDESGVDLSLLRQNLRLTPTERMERHRRALCSVMEVRRAARRAGLIQDP